MNTIASVHAISVAFFMVASIGKLPNTSHRFDGKGAEVFAEGIQGRRASCCGATECNVGQIFYD
jgi:hypothetical protein